MKPSAPARDVALFLGDSTVVDPLVHAFVSERMEQSSQSLDFEIFRAGERPVSEIEAGLRQVGMFSPKRAIWLRAFIEPKKKSAAADEDDEASDDDEEKESDSAVLLSILESGIPPGTLLVISAVTLDARGRLFKWLAKNADVVDRRIQVDQRKNKLGEDALRRTILDRLHELGVRKVGAGVADEMAKRSGNVLGETLQEVDRLVLAQSDPTRLDADDVQSGMRDLALGWVFDFTGALERRDLAAAEQLIARLLADGEPPLRLVALLASHFARLVEARPVVDTLPRGWLRMRGAEFLAGPGASLPDSLRGWPGYFRLKAAAEFSADELRRLHGEVRRLDAALKSTQIAPVLLFSRLLQSACIRRSAA